MRGVYARGCGFRGIDGLLVLLLRNFLLAGELLVTRHIALRLIVVGFRLRELRYGGGRLALRCQNSGASTFHIRGCRIQLARGIGGGDWYIILRGVRAGDGGIVFGARPIYCHLIILWINLDEHSAGFNGLIVVHIHFRNVTCHACADRIDMPIHLGIVRRFPGGQIIPNERTDNRDNYHNRENGPDGNLATRSRRSWIARRRRC